jgi:hypothetical protein
VTTDDRGHEARLTIELDPDSGRIRIHRATPLGTFTETLDR